MECIEVIFIKVKKKKKKKDTTYDVFISIHIFT